MRQAQDNFLAGVGADQHLLQRVPCGVRDIGAGEEPRDAAEERVGMDWAPESSRRARGLPIYALIRALGADGVSDIIRRNCAQARRMAAHLAKVTGVSILNEVVLNQVLVHFGSDERTRAVISRVQAEGTCWAGGAIWQGKQVMRIAMSNWSTTDQDIDRSAEAILRCYDEVRAS